MKSRLLPWLLLAGACMKAPDPAAGMPAAQDDVPFAGHPPIDGTAGGAAPPQSSGAVEFAAPQGWVEEAPDLSFTLRRWKLPEGGVCTITQVGGDVSTNLERWIAQFEVPGGEAQSAAHMGPLDGAPYPTTIVTLAGTFTATRGIGGGPPREGWLLAGAAVAETPLGTLYVKAVAPRTVLEGQLDALWSALRSMKVAP